MTIKNLEQINLEFLDEFVANATEAKENQQTQQTVEVEEVAEKVAEPATSVQLNIQQKVAAMLQNIDLQNVSVPPQPVQSTQQSAQPIRSDESTQISSTPIISPEVFADKLPEAGIKKEEQKETSEKKPIDPVELDKSKETETIRETEKINKINKKTACVKPRPIWKDLVFLILKIAFIALAMVLLFTFLYGLIRYNEPSMSPAIKDGDLVIFYRYTESGYLPQDAVVLEFKGQRQVRRVIATAGDIVDITEDGLMINGSLQQEPNIYQQTKRYEDGIDFPLTVPEGQIFVLSDARTGATDSRIYGCVKIEDTLGKVMALIRRRSI